MFLCRWWRFKQFIYIYIKKTTKNRFFLRTSPTNFFFFKRVALFQTSKFCSFIFFFFQKFQPPPHKLFFRGGEKNPPPLVFSPKFRSNFFLAPLTSQEIKAAKTPQISFGVIFWGNFLINFPKVWGLCEGGRGTIGKGAFYPKKEALSL